MDTVAGSPQLCKVSNPQRHHGIKYRRYWVEATGRGEQLGDYPCIGRCRVVASSILDVTISQHHFSTGCCFSTQHVADRLLYLCGFSSAGCKNSPGGNVRLGRTLFYLHLLGLIESVSSRGGQTREHASPWPLRQAVAFWWPCHNLGLPCSSLS